MSDQGLVVGTEVETKPCSKCKVPKPLDDFGRDPRGRLGRNSWCRACFTQHNMERYRADPEYRATLRKQAAAYRKSDLGALVYTRSELRSRLRGAVRPATKDRLHQRIAELDQQIAALRAGRRNVA